MQVTHWDLDSDVTTHTRWPTPQFSACVTEHPFVQKLQTVRRRGETTGPLGLERGGGGERASLTESLQVSYGNFSASSLQFLLQAFPRNQNYATGGTRPALPLLSSNTPQSSNALQCMENQKPWGKDRRTHENRFQNSDTSGPCCVDNVGIHVYQPRNGRLLIMGCEGVHILLRETHIASTASKKPWRHQSSGRAAGSPYRSPHFAVDILGNTTTSKKPFKFPNQSQLSPHP
jgi:hypothetical protein